MWAFMGIGHSFSKTIVPHSLQGKHLPTHQ